MIPNDTKNDTKIDTNPMKTENTEWNIAELETFFQSAKLPPPPIKLSPTCKITNVRGYIDFHLSVARANEGNKTFIAYLHRLQELKTIIQNTAQ
jgi:hypothetical protein